MTKSERNELIVKLRLQDKMTLEAIGERVGLKKHSIHRILKQNGVSEKVRKPAVVRREQEMDKKFLESKGMTRDEYWKYRKTPESNIATQLLKSTKSSAIKKGLEHDITISDIIAVWNSSCPVLGMEYGEDKWTKRSIDRIDSSIGYLPENIQIISWRANFLKSNGTPEEFKKLSNFLNN